MPPSHVVVDGSNIATEGRAQPSLAQLDDAVRQFQDEFPDTETIVVVDATFGHRIDPSERAAFDEAVAHGELVSPPAGAIGRGDAFVLRIAERVDGQVLSNDSFQEFHAEHPWLFDDGRLIGGKPVSGVGWIFTPRLPVRGPRSRVGSAGGRGGRRTAETAAAVPDRQPRRRRGGRSAAVLEAVEAAVAEATEAAVAPRAEDRSAAPADGTVAATPTRSRRRRRRRKSGDPAVAAAIEAATQEAIGPGEPTTTPKAGSKSASGPQAVNDPLPFIQFISEHPIGARVTGTVSNFVSHGAMVDVGDFCCYVPLSGLGSPPPKSARVVLHRSEPRTFVVAALDPPRRGVQLALPEVYAASVEAAGGSPEGPPSDAAGSPPRRRRSQAPKAPKAALAPTTPAAEKGTAAKRSGTAKTGTAAKAPSSAKAATSAKAAKAAKASTAAKAAKAPTAAKAKPAKAAKAAKATETAKAATRATAARATKATKTAKAATRAAKTAKATKAAQPSKASKKGSPASIGASGRQPRERR
ncbi:MAG: hypothetical protein KGJ77_04445 [Acidobacteriota bacterium]|nr:hypothetical protein [Acidobacteriota bacterium]